LKKLRSPFRGEGGLLVRALAVGRAYEKRPGDVKTVLAFED
jgi:hypothetical protein